MALLILTQRVAEAESALAAAGLSTAGVVESDLPGAMERLESEAWDLVVIDAALAAGAALELVPTLAAAGRMVVVASAEPTLALTMRVLRAGAADVVLFPPPADRLRELASDAAGRGAGGEAGEDAAGAGEWVGSSPALLEAFRAAVRLAGTDAPVLLCGEPGTGKDRLARVIHGASGRSAGPFMAINCEVLPEPLLESELFGHERGGLPGVAGRRAGRASKAAGGTLFVEGLEHLSLRMQHGLVRLLRDGVVTPRGGDDTDVDVRLLASTAGEPEMLHESGRLLDELYWLVAANAIHLAPLRERGEADIRLLADRFVREFAARYRRPVRGVAEDAWTVLTRHEWPGNVAQLRGVMERAVVEADSGVVHAVHLPREVRRTVERMPSELTLRLEDLEKRHIARVLDLTEGHLGRAAEMLGIHRNTLRRKLQTYGIEIE